MKSWWLSLSTREKAMVALGAVAAVLFVLYQALIMPLSRWHTEALAQSDAASVGYRQVILAAQRAGGGAGAEAAGQPVFDAKTPLKSALASSASRAALIVSTTDGDEASGVRMTLAPADPEKLYNWLETVKRDYGAIIVEARISRARNNSELVQADRLIFRRLPS